MEGPHGPLLRGLMECGVRNVEKMGIGMGRDHIRQTC